jgi:hypothetical protein
MNRLLKWLMLALMLMVSTAALAQEQTTSNTNAQVYADQKRTFYVPIPEGWENQSTENYAHFVQDGHELFVTSVPTTDLEAGIGEALKLVDANFAAEPESSETVTVSGDTWTQHTYTLDERPVKTIGFVKNDLTYVIVSAGGEAEDAAFEMAVREFRITPATFSYLVLGLVVSAVIVGGFLLSMVLRYRSFHQDIETLRQLQQEGAA